MWAMQEANAGEGEDANPVKKADGESYWKVERFLFWRRVDSLEDPDFKLAHEIYCKWEGFDDSYNSWVQSIEFHDDGTFWKWIRQNPALQKDTRWLKDRLFECPATSK
jgi:hypothetical protein